MQLIYDVWIRPVWPKRQILYIAAILRQPLAVPPSIMIRLLSISALFLRPSSYISYLISLGRIVLAPIKTAALVWPVASPHTPFPCQTTGSSPAQIPSLLSGQILRSYPRRRPHPSRSQSPYPPLRPAAW